MANDTLYSRVLAEIRNAGFALTNGDLAIRLDANEPSVRRVTRQLEIDREVRANFGAHASDNRLYYTLSDVIAVTR